MNQKSSSMSNSGDDDGSDSGHSESQTQEKDPSSKVGHKRKRHEIPPAEYWKMKKKEQRESRKKRAKQRKEQLETQWATLTEEEKAEKKLAAKLRHDQQQDAEERRHRTCLANLSSSDTPVLLYDVSFNATMNEKGRKSTLSQLKLSHSILRKHNFCLLPYLNLPGDDCKDMVANLAGYEGFKKYPPIIEHARHWRQVFTSGPNTASSTTTTTSSTTASSSEDHDFSHHTVVYLTADSPNVLTDIKPKHAYVIGGFVDHNSKKGLTYSVAQELKVETARLPIDETLTKQEMGQLCRVLTVDKMTEVLSVYIDTRDWRQAFAVLPTRRMKKPREGKAQNGTGEDGTKIDEGSNSDDDADE